MAFGLRESRTLQRRARRRRMLWWLAVLAGLIAAGYYAYETGAMLARQDVTTLKGEVDKLESSVEALTQTNAELQSAVQAERQRNQAWQQR